MNITNILQVYNIHTLNETFHMTRIMQPFSTTKVTLPLNILLLVWFSRTSLHSFNKYILHSLLCNNKNTLGQTFCIIPLKCTVGLSLAWHHFILLQRSNYQKQSRDFLHIQYKRAHTWTRRYHHSGSNKFEVFTLM